MKKVAGKILGIIAKIFAGIILTALLIFGVVSLVLFTRSGFDKAAKLAIDRFSPCRVTIDDSKLTLLKTFPHLGLDLEDVVIYTDLETSPSDTMAYIKSMVAGVDMKQLLKHRNIVVDRIRISDASVLLFKDSLGNSTLDVFTDSTAKEKEKTPFVMPDTLNLGFSFDLSEIALRRASLRYNDVSAGTEASVDEFTMQLDGNIDSLVNGRAKLDAYVNGLAAILTDSTGTITRTTLGTITVNADCDLQLPHVGLDGKVSANDFYAMSGDKTALTDKVSLDIDGAIDLKKMLVDAVCGLTSTEITLNGDSLQAMVNGIDLEVDAKSGQDSVQTVISASGKIGSIGLDMPYDTLSLKLNSIGIDADAVAALSTLEGDANLRLTGKGLDFRNGDSLLHVSADTLSLAASALKNGTVIKATPRFFSRTLHVTLDSTELVPGWPVNVSLPVVTDTCFNWFTLRGGVISVDSLDIYADADVNLHDDGMAAKASVHTGQTSFGHLVSMIPQDYMYLLDGIEINGALEVGINADAVKKGDEFDVRSLDARLSIADLDGSLGDTLTAESQALDLTLTYPGALTTDTYKTANAKIVSPLIKAAIISETTPATATIRNVSIDGLAANIFEGMDKMEFLAVMQAANTKASYDTIAANLDNMELSGYFGYTLIQDKQLELNAALAFDTMQVNMGSLMDINIGTTAISGAATIDTTKTDVLLKYDPKLTCNMKNTGIYGLEVPVDMPLLDFDFNLGKFIITDSHIQLGNSDISLTGDLYNIRQFLEGTGLMTGKMDFNSNHTDMTQLLSLVSGLGSHKADDEEEAERTASANESIPADSIWADSIPADSVIPNPFIVPMGVDFVLNTNINEMEMNGHMFNNVGGEVSIKNGIIVVRELGFHSTSGEMQLTAIYRTPADDDLYVGMDFHLLNIEVADLIDLIPSVDSIVPMLKAFSGKAQFHLAGESHLDGYYMPKMPTLIGAAGIEGRNLVVMDSEMFRSLRRKLLMSRKAEPVIDSLDVELQVLRNKVDLYPMVLKMDRYKVALGGRYNINKDMESHYHISLLKTPLPIRFGVTIEDTMDNIAAHPLKCIKLKKCEYPKDFQQVKTGTVEQHVLYMKDVIAKTLRENVLE